MIKAKRHYRDLFITVENEHYYFDLLKIVGILKNANSGYYIIIDSSETVVINSDDIINVLIKEFQEFKSEDYCMDNIWSEN